MEIVSIQATGEAMPVATALTLPKSGIVLTIAMHAGKPLMFGRSGKAS